MFSGSTCDKVYKQIQALREQKKKRSGSKTIRDDIELEKIKIVALKKQQIILELKTLKLSLEMKKMDENTFSAANEVFMERSSTNVANNNNAICSTNYVNDIIVKQFCISINSQNRRRKFIANIDRIGEKTNCGLQISIIGNNGGIGTLWNS